MKRMLAIVLSALIAVGNCTVGVRAEEEMAQPVAGQTEGILEQGDASEEGIEIIDVFQKPMFLADS